MAVMVTSWSAEVYSGGLSEEVLGKALGSHRDEVLIATKVRLPMGDGPNDAGLSRHHIIRGVEASLRRLDTDYIDLYQVHEWDGQTPLEETLQALDDLVRWGRSATSVVPITPPGTWQRRCGPRTREA